MSSYIIIKEEDRDNFKEAAEDYVVKSDEELLENADKHSDKKSNIPKRHSAKVFNRYCKDLIYTSYSATMQLQPSTPVSVAVKRIAKNMLVSESSVYNVLREFKEYKDLRQPKIAKKRYLEVVNDIDRNFVRKSVHDFYFRNDLPTVDKVLEVVNSAFSPPPYRKTQFYKLLKELNFQAILTGSGSVLVDKEEVIVARAKYLRAMHSLRKQGKTIYYLSESWIYTSNLVRTKARPDYGIDSSFGNRNLLAAHIGSEKGLVKDALWLHESASVPGAQPVVDTTRFEQWFSELLPKLESGSVIVLNGEAPCHLRKVVGTPDLSWSKDSIKDWLQDRAITFESDSLKAELLHLSRTRKECLYVLDELALPFGITVLRLPPYHAVLNPMEALWTKLKDTLGKQSRDVRNYSVPTPSNPIEMLRLKMKLSLSKNEIVIKSIEDMNDYWKTLVPRLTAEVEDMMWELDRRMETAIEPFLIDLNYDSMNSDSGTDD